MILYIFKFFTIYIYIQNSEVFFKNLYLIYSIKSINNMLRSIFNEIYYLTYTVDVSPSNLKEYKNTPEKGLNILKSIIKDHYKVVYYKINKFK